MTPRNGHAPPGVDTTQRFHQLQQEARAYADAEYRRGMIAMRLAPDLDTYRALIAGQPVHPDRLDRAYLHQLRQQGTQL